MKYKYNKRVIAPLAMVLSVAMFTGCTGETNEVVELIEETVVVDTVSLEKGDFIINGEFIGSISPYEASYVMPLVSGEVTEIPVELGQEIKEGDILCKFDSEGAQLQLESAMASYNTIQANVNQATGGSTVLQDIQSDSGIQQIENQVDNAEIALANAKSQVADMNESLDDLEDAIDESSDGADAVSSRYKSVAGIRVQIDALEMKSLDKSDYTDLSDAEIVQEWGTAKTDKELAEKTYTKAEDIIAAMEELDMETLVTTDTSSPEQIALCELAADEPAITDDHITVDGLKILKKNEKDAQDAFKIQDPIKRKVDVCNAARASGISWENATDTGLSMLESSASQAKSATQGAKSQKESLEQGKSSGESGIKQAQIALDSANESLSSNKQAASITQEQVRGETQAILNTQLDAANVGIKSAQMQLDMYTLKSPISGVVESIGVTEKAMAASGNIAFVISNKDSMTVTFYVSEPVRNSLVLGQPITVDRSGVNYSGTIMEIGAMVDPQKGLFQIKGNIDASGADLLTGSNVIIYTDTYKEEDSYIIPYDAVYYDGGESYVYTAKEGIVVKKQVETGLFDDNTISIVSGLSNDDIIITSWSPNLRDGIAVEIKED